MRRAILALLILFFVGPMPWTVQRFPVDNHRQQVTARPLPDRPPPSGSLHFVRGWHLVSPHSRFGGFSALARTGPGAFILVGDNGYRTRLTVDGAGRVGAVDIRPLPTPDGRPASKAMADVEALVVDSAGNRAWIALEGVNQIWRLDVGLSRIEARRKLPQPRWPANRGAEAIARLPDGRMIVFSEDADDDPRGREALLYAGDPAMPGPPPQRFFYDARGKGLVSDAAVLPDGRILLVHRRLGFDPVFTTILAVVDPADIRTDGVVRSQTIGRVPRRLAENYEGAAVGVEGGRTYLWLVSDDNFNRWQRSLLLQFELVDLPPVDMPDSKKAARKPAA
ncbi:MAG: esterase-like activity of phytase family protein [Sphingopyxis solisilvae]|uniref:esterase-like activity of phytase family protein n=1 Tax=Sphingopyxis solisilvae TaxID=1886788 RepID=UPI004035F6F9